MTSPMASALRSTTAAPAQRGAALRLAAGAARVMALAGCATTRSGMTPGERLDPWENWNRKVFAFNEGLDEHVLRPVATGYAKVVPRPVREAIRNFFANFADAWSAVNNLLQGKPEAAGNDVARFGLNTLFGVFGLLDVASEAGLDHQYEDFGQTLGHWGIGAGAYLVWPLIGPSTVRETVALPFDRAVSPALLIDGGRSKVSIYALQLVNTRAGMLYGQDEYVDSGCGMGREATLYLLERGVRLTGTDAWSWDAPFVYTKAKVAATGNKQLIWEGHKAGRDIGYCHLEKLHNLEVLPSSGFAINCFPVKVKAASAGWTRAVAIFGM